MTIEASDYSAYEPRRAELVSYGTPDYDNYQSPPQQVVVEEDQPSEEVQPQEQAPSNNEAVVEPQHPEVVVEQEVEIPDEQRIFQEMFEKTFGMKPEDFKQQLESDRAEKERVEAERQLSRLQSDWNVDEVTMSERLSLIKERLESLPETVRVGLDNYDGINLIWNAIQGEQGYVDRQPSLPRYEKNSIAPSAQGNKPMFTRAQLAAMSPEEYRRNNDAILYAYQNNLVA